MFKVHENEDGSTTIFCSETGRQIYTIPSNNQPRIPERTSLKRPINVVGPCRVNTLNKCNKSESSTEEEQGSDYEKDSSFRKAICCLPPIPIKEQEKTEDYFNETATKDEFARCLNLVPSRKFKVEPLEKILKEFPLRLLSRSKTFRSVDISSEDWQFHKPPDDLPLSSNLGVKFLKLNKSRNFLNEQKLSIAIKKYDTFCRHPFNTPNPSECNFPKLRCREKKFYPTVATKASKYQGTHVYSYGRRQRLERMKTIKAGLDRKSRRLLRMCNAKKLFVKIQRLDPAEIEYWLSKKTEPILIVLDDSDDEVDVTTLSAADSSSSQRSCATARPQTINVGDASILDVLKRNNTEISCVLGINKINIPNKSNNLTPDVTWSVKNSSSTSLLYNMLKPGSSTNEPSNNKLSILPTNHSLLRIRAAKKYNCIRCDIPLIDITKKICKFQNEYYVKSTNIKVPFYKSHLLKTFLHRSKQPSLNTNRPRSLSLSYAQRRTNLASAVSIPVTPAKPQSKAQNRVLVPVTQHRSSSAPVETSVIQVIDLTEDSPPKPQKNNQIDSKSTQIYFKCYACKMDWLFRQDADYSNTINDHMKIYHYVQDPGSLLSSRFDRLHNRTIIEAFPGYH